MEMAQTACFADRVMATLSGGERQQVSIAAALAQQAEIFLLDEPATYLDYKHQRDIHLLLAKITRPTVVSNMDFFSICDFSQADFSGAKSAMESNHNDGR